MGVRDWFKKRGQRKKQKESTSEPKKPMGPMIEQKPEELPPETPAQETGESVPKPAEEETKEPTQETVAKEAEETALEPVAQETEKVAQEPPTEKADEPTTEPATEEKEESAPETPAQETEESTSEQVVAVEPEELIPEFSTQEAKESLIEPAVDETEESGPELPAKKTEKSIPAPSWKFAFRRSKKRKQEKKEKESAPEPAFLKLLILPVTLAAMLLGLSIMPLFPQPLPAILAFLIAFLVYKKPIIGMPIGGLVIGLGLMYNLSKMNFISMLGSTQNREAFVFVLLFLFIALPIIFHSRRAVLSIDLGIIAAILLFFSQTYFLAIPLIFTAVVLFKKVSFLTVVYYGLISVPLEIMQYLNLVLPIERWDWWVEPGTSPPVYVPLTQIFTNVQQSMLQFRLYDTSLIVSSISDQFTMNPPVMPHNVLEMISHYLDSLPGILMFLFMVVGIVTAFIFFTRSFLSKSNIAHAERLMPMLSATVGVALFFILAAGLQGALAFRVDVTSVQTALAIFATLLFTFPSFLIDYTPKKRATVDMIMQKAEELKAKLQIFEDELYEVKTNLPISCGPFEVKVMMVRDRLNDVLSKASMRLEEASEIDKIFNEIDSLSKEIDNLMAELEVAVEEYQIFVNCEYSKWLGMFKDIGLETEFAAKAPFQQGLHLKERIDQIKEVLGDGRSFANEIIEVAEQAYEVMRTFYDPALPEKSQSIAFAQKKLEEKVTPWIALDALFIAVTNWNKQYKVQISESVEHLRDSLASIATLDTRNESLQLILGDDFPKVMENAKKARDIEMGIEKGTIKIVNVMTIKNVFQKALVIARDVLSVLYEKLKSGEETLELLAPSEDFLWEKKNDALRDRMTSAMEMVSSSAEVKLSEVLQSLPKFLSHIDECIKTIALYNDTEELLLNYPIAERAVENLFREKQRISAQDLPFELKYAEEYLKLFHRQKYGEFSLDRTNMLLTKKT